MLSTKVEDRHWVGIICVVCDVDAGLRGAVLICATAELWLIWSIILKVSSCGISFITEKINEKNDKLLYSDIQHQARQGQGWGAAAGDNIPYLGYAGHHLPHVGAWVLDRARYVSFTSGELQLLLSLLLSDSAVCAVEVQTKAIREDFTIMEKAPTTRAFSWLKVPTKHFYVL